MAQSISASPSAWNSAYSGVLGGISTNPKAPSATIALPSQARMCQVRTDPVTPAAGAAFQLRDGFTISLTVNVNGVFRIGTQWTSYGAAGLTVKDVVTGEVITNPGPILDFPVSGGEIVAPIVSSISIPSVRVNVSWL